MALKTDYGRYLVDGGDTTTIILTGETTSAIFDPSGTSVRGIYLPSNWTACNISFMTSKLPGFSPAYLKTNVDGTPLSIATIAGQDLPLLAYLFDYTTYLQVVCSIPQIEDVVIDFGMAPIYKGIK